jgi:RHS repeat-associated protein
LGTLTYNYGTNGNQLQSVTGGYNKTYTYNANGSMITDGQLNIVYNELDLPKQVTGNANIVYEYDATGSKLKKQTNTETRYYVNGIEYVVNSTTPNPVIDILYTAQGLVRNNNGNYTFEYFIKDHLGNTRIVYNNAGTVLQQTDYYPYGLEINRYISGNKIKKLFNGIEKNDELGTYEAIFRELDPVIGRWLAIDPKPDYTQSLYSSMNGNPIRYTDPLGDTLRVDGNEKAKALFSKISDKGLGGFYKTKIAKDGSVSFVRTIKKGEMGNREAAYYKAVSGILKSKSITSIGLVQNDKKVIGGSYSRSEIDVADVTKWAGSTAMSDVGVLAHEIVEQNAKQVYGLDYDEAHSIAKNIEAGINKYQRNDNRQTDNLKYNKQGQASGTMNLFFTPVRISPFIWSPNWPEKKISIILIDNNISKVEEE